MIRTHLVDLYTPLPSETRDGYGKPLTGWTPEPYAVDVVCNLQPIYGKVTQDAAGRLVDATYYGFFPPGTLIHPDAGVVVKQVLTDPPDSWMGPRYFRVKNVGPQGGRWDVETMLDDTPQAIPGV